MHVFCVKFSETAQMFDLFDSGMVKLEYKQFEAYE
jgi:hypothetical protein